MNFREIKLNLALALLTVIVSFSFSYTRADISKAFPDMSYVFEHVVFYNQDGELVNFEEHKNKVLLIFFGYTHCPDVCPMTLNKIDIVLSKLDNDKKKNLKFFFISVDPERDTPQVVKDYLSSFENDFIGITGEPEKIYLLSQSWGILSQKIFLENGEYNIDHSSPVILLKDGKYVARISPRDDIKRSIKIIKKHL